MKQIFEFLLMIVLMQAHRLFFESAPPLMVRACNGDVSFYFKKNSLQFILIFCVLRVQAYEDFFGCN